MALEGENERGEGGVVYLLYWNGRGKGVGIRLVAGKDCDAEVVGEELAEDCRAKVACCL